MAFARGSWLQNQPYISSGINAASQPRPLHTSFSTPTSSSLLTHDHILSLSCLLAHKMSFGFSAGDFISALSLVNTVITSLRSAGGSSAEYQSLISQLYTLESALLRVKHLELDDSQHAEVIALRQAAAQCQRTIDAFEEQIKKYQPSLRAEGSGNNVRDCWRKVKWVLCKKDDLAKFKADLMGHTESIELLLMTVQM